jgi:phosphohistidine phosphatase
LILCSSARRARETLDLVAPVFGDHVEIRVEDDLYWADDDDLLSRLHAVGDDIASVLIVGHNPALHELALGLAGDGDTHAVTQLRTKFPTGALATLKLGNVSWRDVLPGRGDLAALVVPRQLGQHPA